MWGIQFLYFRSARLKKESTTHKASFHSAEGSSMGATTASKQVFNTALHARRSINGRPVSQSAPSPVSAGRAKSSVDYQTYQLTIRCLPNLTFGPVVCTFKSAINMSKYYQVRVSIELRV
jgi:hypothetical protein